MTLPTAYGATDVMVQALGAVLTETVYASPPNARPASGGWVVLRRVGGVGRDLVVDEATFALEAWHVSSQFAAERLCNEARKAWHDLPRQRVLSVTIDGDAVAVPIYRTQEFAGPAFLPDPETTSPRFSATLTVALRGAH